MIIQLGRDFRRSLLQPLAQSRISFKPCSSGAAIALPDKANLWMGNWYCTSSHVQLCKAEGYSMPRVLPYVPTSCSSGAFWMRCDFYKSTEFQRIFLPWTCSDSQWTQVKILMVEFSSQKDVPHLGCPHVGFCLSSGCCYSQGRITQCKLMQPRLIHLIRYMCLHITIRACQWCNPFLRCVSGASSVKIVT